MMKIPLTRTSIGNIMQIYIRLGWAETAAAVAVAVAVAVVATSRLVGRRTSTSSIMHMHMHMQPWQQLERANNVDVGSMIVITTHLIKMRSMKGQMYGAMEVAVVAVGSQITKTATMARKIRVTAKATATAQQVELELER
jgi:hypothetical protein